MSADVLQFHSKFSGNGAREALKAALQKMMGHSGKLDAHDLVLAELWAAGFKIVPLTGDE